MREIKFRAWDKQAKQWYNMDLFIIQNDGMYESHREFEDGVSLTDKECDLMQYTGVRDKNDKEIYDGDIVKYTERNLEHALGGYGEPWVEKKRIIGWIMHGWFLPKGFAKDIEVIGNIYENPELLEDGE